MLRLTGLFGLALLLVCAGSLPAREEPATTGEETVLLTGPRINALYTAGQEDPPFPQQAVSWFGQVTPTTNYADVRVSYNDSALFVTLHIFDRLLWFDQTPAAGDLAAWDAATLYVNLDGNVGGAPSPTAHRFVAQLNNNPGTRPAYQVAYRGDGTAWEPAATAFTTETGWRGNSPNDNTDDRGWSVTFRVPFAGLGLSQPPEMGSVWGLALAVHDRDDTNGTPIPVQSWPAGMAGGEPATWGQIRFGLPGYTHPPAGGGAVVTVRHGLDGAAVSDAHVGGHTDCGDPYAPDYFDSWGDANYAGYEQVNVQNQRDVADWPCFSKFYVTFPLGTVPAGKEIISATLTLHQFGNANPADAFPSYIQALTVDGAWNESTITWNDAPPAGENVAITRVEPLDTFPGWPGVPRQWDVSRAVAGAYADDATVRLVLYSADGAYHSGKYFSSSDVEAWNEMARPTLRIRWGTSIDADDLLYHYLPLAVRP